MISPRYFRRLWFVCAIAAACFGLPSGAASTASVELLSPPAVRTVSVSPDGRHLAILRSAAEKDTLVIVRRADMSIAAGVSSNEGERFHAVTWAAADRLLVEPAVDGGMLNPALPTGGLVVMGLDGATGRTLLDGGTAARGRDTVIVSILPDDSEHILAIASGICEPPVCTADESRRSQLVRINLETAEATVVADTALIDARFLSDPRGVEVLAIGRNETGEVRVDRLERGTWAQLLEFDPLTEPAVIPVAITGPGRAYALTNRVDTLALHELNLDSGELTQVFRDRRSDVDDLIFGFGQRRLLAVRSDPGFPSWHYLDDAHPFTAVHKALRVAFADSDVAVTSFTADGVEAVVRVHNDRNDGDYYIVNMQTRATEFLLKGRPGLTAAELGTMEPFQVETRDGFTLRGLLTRRAVDSAPQPMVVWVHDAPNRSRVEWALVPEVQLLAQRGYAVLQINYRGSAGLGRGYALAGGERQGRVVQRDIVDATRWAVDRGVADEGRICIYGRGYGGFAAVKALTGSGRLFNCAIAIDGFYDLAAPHGVLDRPLSLWREFVIIPQLLDRDDLARSPMARIDRIEAPVLLVGDSDQTLSMREALLAREKQIVWQGELATPEDYEALLAFIDQHIVSGALSHRPKVAMTFGASLSPQQVVAFEALVAQMQGELQVLVQSRSFSVADIRQRIAAVVDSYDRRVSALVDTQQWVLYEPFKVQLAKRLETELNVVRVR